MDNLEDSLTLEGVSILHLFRRDDNSDDSFI